MRYLRNKKIVRTSLFSITFIIVALILWNTYDFSKKFSHEERLKMEVLAAAFERFNNADLDVDVSLEDRIIKSNHNIPMIVTDGKNNILRFSNLDPAKSKDKIYLLNQLALMKNENKPILISYQKNNVNLKRYIYYRNSELIYKLKYYPIALLFILCLFGAVIYLIYKTNKISEQNKLWVGMAKETAHQIGTPLSSLLGWVEIMRLENVSENTIGEIEKDISRLNTIAERFSKIGSIPVLSKSDVIIETKKSISYLKSRSSKSVKFEFNNNSSQPIYANLNLQLYAWVIENLVKNAIDSMQGKGNITIDIRNSDKSIYITINDTGKGIPKSMFRKIFEPGFTTKKRGWGLGLSLAKRIIEIYHKGKIFVKKSELGKGTSFEIQLRKIKS